MLTVPGHGSVRRIDLEHEARVDDRLVLVPEHIRECVGVLLFVTVVGVGDTHRDDSW